MASKLTTKPKKQRANKEVAPPRDGLTKGMQARERIISVAETLFNKQGFDGASMRDIAAAAKMQPASMYYHFGSKEELLWAVWEKGGIELLNRVNEAIAPVTDPWQRLETACVAHVSGLLDWRRANQALFVMPPWHYPESIKDRVIALRDEYESIFIRLIDDLPLSRDINRQYLRLTMIGALSWTLFWFKKERDDAPAVIAKQILSLLRSGFGQNQKVR
ncbi:TetR/AcrR family transcriptional regulator [Bradyrhizobium sp. Ash2021]|uniref:TetR/AcrR family transcriptional regulator n=1 Tax=Bradyrhizobium sp. Ash2021 TaxID=2954771 RepID=UPI002816416B|nr:TetR/AcrR family transcriptional regulator [Bradyrhizobium sp. Ash2021]WMT76491.1 TetR/AcrR family transcriptional regulator [Bradyrhizobium sp. Ash2021]